MVQAVEERHIVPAEQARQHPEVDLEAGREGQHRVDLHEVLQLLFELIVHGQCAVQQARACATGAVLVEGTARRFDDFRVACQPEVVVRTQHDHLAALDGDHGILRR